MNLLETNKGYDLFERMVIALEEIAVSLKNITDYMQ